MKAAQRCDHRGKLKAAYIKTPHPFPELESFISKTAESFHEEIELHVYEAQPLKEGFKRFIADAKVSSVLVGIRSTDPYGGIKAPRDLV